MASIVLYWMKTYCMLVVFAWLEASNSSMCLLLFYIMWHKGCRHYAALIHPPSLSCIQDLKRAREQVVNMENERSHMEPKLRRADQLQNEVNTLSCELQVLGELYQQQREEAHDLMRHSQREQELGVLCSTLIKDKEASQKIVASLSQQLQVSMARGEELEQVVSRREEELTSLQQKLFSAQGRYQAKMKVRRNFHNSRKSMSITYVVSECSVFCLLCVVLS